MKKSKRKPAVAIKRPQNPLDAPVPSHTNQGGSLVLGLKSALGTLDGSISHIPSADLPPSPAVIPSSGAGTSTAREANGSPVDNTNASLDGFLVEDCSDEEDLEEEQLDFSCSEEEYERSPPSSLTPVTPELPSSPTPVTPELPASPKGAIFNPFNNVKAGKSLSSPTSSSRWKDLFISNHNISSYLKLMHFSSFNDIQSCSLLTEDLDHSCDDWKLCVIGYVSGKFSGYRALNSIIGNTWKCEATLTIHESGWLVYKFQNEENKFSVLCGGLYLVYGQPLIFALHV
jgi:hypothetical protein